MNLTDKQINNLPESSRESDRYTAAFYFLGFHIHLRYSKIISTHTDSLLWSATAWLPGRRNSEVMAIFYPSKVEAVRAILYNIGAKYREYPNWWPPELEVET